MEYNDIKDKILGWLRDKESFDDRDLFFLFRDLCRELEDSILGAGEEEIIEDEDAGLDPDGLEAYGEEINKKVAKLPNLDDDDDDDYDDDDDEDEVEPVAPSEMPPEPPKFEETAEKAVKSIYAKKPRVKPK